MSFIDVATASSTIGSTIHGFRDTGSMKRSELSSHEKLIGIGIIGTGAFFSFRDKRIMPLAYSLGIAVGAYVLFEYLYKRNNRPLGQTGYGVGGA